MMVSSRYKYHQIIILVKMTLITCQNHLEEVVVVIKNQPKKENKKVEPQNPKEGLNQDVLIHLTREDNKPRNPFNRCKGLTSLNLKLEYALR